MGTAHAVSLNVPMALVSAVSETPYGLLFTPNLKSLPVGVHGFHVHENGSCEVGVKDGAKVAALGAVGHLDPKKREASWALRQWALGRPACGLRDS